MQSLLFRGEDVKKSVKKIESNVIHIYRSSELGLKELNLNLNLDLALKNVNLYLNLALKNSNLNLNLCDSVRDKSGC